MMPGLFDEQVLLRKLDQMGTPLARLDSIVDRQPFLPIIKNALGRENPLPPDESPIQPCSCSRSILIFQSLRNLGNEDTERELLKNLLARRFVGLSGAQFRQDFITIWRFKEALTRAGLIETLHDAFSKQLDEMGFQASKGQIVDASIVPAPKQRNSREENEAIRAGEPPADWPEAKRRQKDCGRPLNQEERSEPFRMQEPRCGGCEAQVYPRLEGDRRQRARRPGVRGDIVGEHES